MLANSRYIFRFQFADTNVAPFPVSSYLLESEVWLLERDEYFQPPFS